MKFNCIVMQNNLSWQNHLNYIHPKLSKEAYMIRRLIHTVSTKVILYVYYAYIHSYLTYGTLLWANNYLCTSLSLIINQTVGLMCKASIRAHCKDLFFALKVMSVSCIYIFQHLIYAKKNLQSFTLNSDAHFYNTR